MRINVKYINNNNLDMHLEIKSVLAQEMTFHGVEMAGPAKDMYKAGARGRWKNNLQRDLLRKVQHVASWFNIYV